MKFHQVYFIQSWLVLVHAETKGEDSAKNLDKESQARFLLSTT
jgi:hypothetical protein